MDLDKQIENSISNENSPSDTTIWNASNSDGNNWLDEDLPASVLSPAPALASGAAVRKQLTGGQAEKFRRYLDERLLNVSRNFIQRIKGQGYTDISMLMSELDRILDLIWYSIANTSHYGGQFETFYLLRISNDFVDEIEGYYNPGEPPTAPKQIIRFLQKLDNMFEELIDRGGILSQTDKVRLESIAERTRVTIIKAFAHIRGYELDIAKTYEKSLERTAGGHAKYMSSEPSNNVDRS